MATGPFVKVYQTIADDPMFERVYSNPMALGTWLRMLLIAEAMYPASAPMPARTPTVRLLIEVGLVIEKPLNRYSMRGQEAERERRSHAGRIGAAVRWHGDRNADPMLEREEKRREEKSDGQSPTMLGPGEPPNPRHEGQHPDCYVCGTAKATP